MSRLVRFLAVVALVGAVTFAISGADASDDGAKRRASHRLGSEWRPDFQAAKRYANGRSGQVRFMIVDPFGRSHRLHHTGTAPMASLFKALLLATYLSEPNVRHRSLRDWERDLLGPMIKRSDDEAATRVRDIVGAGSVKGTARQADMQDFKYDPVWGLSRSSPRDQAHFFLRLERFIPERHEGYAKRLLAGIVRSQRWGVGRVASGRLEALLQGRLGRRERSRGPPDRAVRAGRMPGGALDHDRAQPQPPLRHRDARGRGAAADAGVRGRRVLSAQDPAPGARARPAGRPRP